MYFCYFYPTGLDLERRRRPWLSLLLMGSMAIAFAWQLWWPTALRWHPWELIFYPGSHRPWTAITALFLHAGWLHLAGNMIYLMVFLPVLEDRLGRVGLLLLFLVTGVGGNLAHGLAAWHDWLGQGGLGILGASGAISGLLGFALVRLPYARVGVAYWVFAPLAGQNRAGRRYVPLPVAVVLWLLLQVGQAALASETGSAVSYPAHLGGFALGVLLALMLGGLREGRAEATLARARRYLAQGEAWAAAGEYSEYLGEGPAEPEVELERARALVMAGVREEAQETYRRVYRAAARARRWNLALEALSEGRRCLPGLGLERSELATAAHRAEKIGDRDLAAKIYQDLVLKGGRHPDRDRAWVRLVLLLHADPGRREEAAEWLERARQELPPGAWRDYLEREFSPAPASRGGDGSAPGELWPAPGS
jgi:membrane associated rhomboid family serine protease